MDEEPMPDADADDVSVEAGDLLDEETEWVEPDPSVDDVDDSDQVEELEESQTAEIEEPAEVEEPEESEAAEVEVPGSPGTGHAGVDDVLAGLSRLDDLGVHEHVAVFEEAHRGLRRALDDGGA